MGPWAALCLTAWSALTYSWLRARYRGRVNVPATPVRWREADNIPSLLGIAAVFALWLALVLTPGASLPPLVHTHGVFGVLLADLREIGIPVRSMRLASCVFGLFATATLFLALRRQTWGNIAARTLMVGLAGAGLARAAISDPAAAIGLAALLAGHRALSSALRGRVMSWARFSLASTIVLAAQPVWVVWHVGYAIVLRHDRIERKALAFALLPAVLAALPLAVLADFPTPHSMAAGFSSLPLALRSIFLDGGVIAAFLLFFVHPVEWTRSVHVEDDALPWALGLSTVAALVLAYFGYGSISHVLPVLPLAALAVAGRMPRMLGEWTSADRRMLLIATLVAAASTVLMTRKIGFL